MKSLLCKIGLGLVAFLFVYWFIWPLVGKLLALLLFCVVIGFFFFGTGKK